jgi:hypothetical protein
MQESERLGLPKNCFGIVFVDFQSLVRVLKRVLVHFHLNIALSQVCENCQLGLLVFDFLCESFQVGLDCGGKLLALEERVALLFELLGIQVERIISERDVLGVVIP